MDENVDPIDIMSIRRKKSDLLVMAVGEPNTPAKSTLDPEILIWCEAYNFILVTNNRHSMPVHLAENISQKRHVPGIFILNPEMTIGETIEELLLIAECSFDGEYQDQIVFLPIP